MESFVTITHEGSNPILMGYKQKSGKQIVISIVPGRYAVDGPILLLTLENLNGDVAVFPTNGTLNIQLAGHNKTR